MVLMSFHLDWIAWVVSGNLLAWICFMLAKPRVKAVFYLGVLALAGSVLQVLPTILPKYGPVLMAGWVGGILISCTAVALAIVGVVYSREVFSITSMKASRLLLTSLLALVIPLQVWSIATMFPLIRPPREYPRFDVVMASGRFFQTLFPLTAVLFVLLVTEWLWLPAVAKVLAGREKGKATYREVASGRMRPYSLSWRILAGISILAGVLVAGYQWSCGYPMGDDAGYYVLMLSRMNATGFQAAFSTERPFFFLALYVAERILGLDSLLLLRLLVVTLAAILVASAYCFTLFVMKSEKTAALAALFAAVSPHVTVGVDYFIVANWLGIPLIMFFLYCFWKGTVERSKRWTAGTIALSGLILGFHYFTWLFLMFMLLIYFLLGVAEKGFGGKANVRYMAVVITASVGVAAPAILLAFLAGGGTLASLNLAQHTIGILLSQASPVNFLTFLANLGHMYEYFAREHYAIPLMYLLALVGFAATGRLGNDRTRLVRSWLIASCLGIIVVRINELWRFVYVLPLEMLAALGFVTVLEYTGFKEESMAVRGENTDVRRTGFELITFLLFGALLAFSTLPSAVLLLVFGPVAALELLFPSEEGKKGIMFLLITSLALEQMTRVLATLA